MGAWVQSCAYNFGVRPRFHMPAIDSGELDEDESAHLTRVLRLRTGDEIDVFDGEGRMFHARVVETGRARARVALIGPAAAAAEPAVRVTLVMSVLKGDKMDGVVRDAVMMGVAAVQPVVAARTEMSLATLSRGHRVERWTRIAIASVKQCGRAVVPVMQQPLEISSWIARRSPEPVLVLREPAAGMARRLREVMPSPAVQLLIGPEGGWSDGELVAFEGAGFEVVSLGARTIRADAAPTIALSALYEAWSAW
jgi:16S rRNA (uracil1498-N3)-methyltransferase